MATHQTHRLPWTTLADVYASVTIQDGRYRYFKTEAQEKQIAHFARCLVDALKEFATTDTRLPVDEDGNSLDPTMWEIHPYGDKFVPILQRRSKWPPYFIDLLCGHMDGGHPEWMARRLLPSVRDLFSAEHKPMTAEMQQAIRDHSALLFRCLYSISGDNRAIKNVDMVASSLGPF